MCVGSLATDMYTCSNAQPLWFWNSLLEFHSPLRFLDKYCFRVGWKTTLFLLISTQCIRPLLRSVIPWSWLAFESSEKSPPLRDECSKKRWPRMPCPCSQNTLYGQDTPGRVRVMEKGNSDRNPENLHVLFGNQSWAPLLPHECVVFCPCTIDSWEQTHVSCVFRLCRQLPLRPLGDNFWQLFHMYTFCPILWCQDDRQKSFFVVFPTIFDTKPSGSASCATAMLREQSIGIGWGCWKTSDCVTFNFAISIYHEVNGFRNNETAAADRAFWPGNSDAIISPFGEGKLATFLQNFLLKLKK